MSQPAVYRQTSINNYVNKKRHFTQRSIKDYAVPKRRVPSSFTGHTSVSDVNKGNKFVKQPLDMLACVTAFLDSKDKVQLFSTCKSMYRDSSRCVALHPFTPGPVAQLTNLHVTFDQHLHKLCNHEKKECDPYLARFTDLSPLMSGIRKAYYEIDDAYCLSNWLTMLPSLTNVTNLYLYNNPTDDSFKNGIPIPNSVKTISIDHWGTKWNYVLSDNIEKLHIYFGSTSLLRRTEVVTLPSNLHAFSFHSGCRPVNDCRFQLITLPGSVKKVRLAGNYDFTLRGSIHTFSVIPSHVESLDLSKMSNSDKLADDTDLWNFVDDIKLPSGLKMLILPDQTGYSLHEVCKLNQLTMIDFGSNFNKSLEGITLPSSLKVVIFGSLYNKPFPKHIFHEGLEKLYLNSCTTSQKLPIVLPSTLRVFSYTGYSVTCFKKFILPKNLHRLELHQCLDSEWSLRLNHIDLVELVIEYYNAHCVNSMAFPPSLRLLILRVNDGDDTDVVIKVPQGCKLISGIRETAHYLQDPPSFEFDS